MLSWGSNPGVGQAVFLLEAVGENLFLVFSSFQRLPGFPGLEPPFLFFFFLNRLNSKVFDSL